MITEFQSFWRSSQFKLDNISITSEQLSYILRASSWSDISEYAASIYIILHLFPSLHISLSLHLIEDPAFTWCCRSIWTPSATYPEQNCQKQDSNLFYFELMFPGKPVYHSEFPLGKPGKAIYYGLSSSCSSSYPTASPRSTAHFFLMGFPTYSWTLSDVQVVSGL